jgi:hypothetical protein
MKTPRLILSAVFGLAAAGAIRAADDLKPAPRAEVIFSQPEKFADVKDDYMGTDKGRDAILSLISEHIVKQAAHYVPAGQMLTVTVTDVDLAGEFEPWHGPSAMDIRIVKDLYPPRIDLSFKLTDAAGKVIKEGTRKLRDLAFNMKISINRDDPLRHEKALIDDWLRQDFTRIKGG